MGGGVRGPRRLVAAAEAGDAAAAAAEGGPARRGRKKLAYLRGITKILFQLAHFFSSNFISEISYRFLVALS